MKRKLLIISPLFIFIFFNRAQNVVGDAGHQPAAVAILQPTSGNKVQGRVSFFPQGEKVKVVANLNGLTPGHHGFHIHEKGDCSASDGSSAGGHFNPTGTQHGAPIDKNRHAGDLGNIVADEKGTATLEWTDPMLKLQGPNSVIGKSIIVHEKADDLKTQPSGDAGGRVACGVIALQSLKDQL